MSRKMRAERWNSAERLADGLAVKEDDGYSERRVLREVGERAGR